MEHTFKKLENWLSWITKHEKKLNFAQISWNRYAFFLPSQNIIRANMFQ